eukprot:scaffold681114_cov41-Prasinocladus_malaysianus.AAC.1
MEDYAIQGSFVPGSSQAPGVMSMKQFLRWHKDELSFRNERDGTNKRAGKVHAVDVLWRLRHLQSMKVRDHPEEVSVNGAADDKAKVLDVFAEDSQDTI